MTENDLRKNILFVTAIGLALFILIPIWLPALVAIKLFQHLWDSIQV